MMRPGRVRRMSKAQFLVYVEMGFWTLLFGACIWMGILWIHSNFP